MYFFNILIHSLNIYGARTWCLALREKGERHYLSLRGLRRQTLALEYGRYQGGGWHRSLWVLRGAHLSQPWKEVAVRVDILEEVLPGLDLKG